MHHIIYMELGPGAYLEDVPVSVEYDCTPYVPAQITGPVEACYPAEGGEVTVEGAVAALGPSPGVTLNLVDLARRVEDECHDELADHAHEHRGPDPDDIYDRWRDDRLTTTYTTAGQTIDLPVTGD